MKWRYLNSDIEKVELEGLSRRLAQEPRSSVHQIAIASSVNITSGGHEPPSLGILTQRREGANRKEKFEVSFLNTSSFFQF
jgi:hypothetical protein